MSKNCPICKKRMGLLGINCRCGETICIHCRHPDKHNCSFDYVSFDKKKLAKQLIQVVSEKVSPI